METKSKEAIGKNRCINLKNISGLTVKHRFDCQRNEHVFAFHALNQSKEIFTYSKAKVYAEGIQLGRKL
jgi:hypothetical protein